jgi:negative regulator of sigma E activity
LVVHNGSSQATVSTTKAIATAEVVEYMIYSDGTGNVTLYINGTQEATSSAGPTGATADSQGVYREQVEQTITAATRLVANCYSGQLIIER